jgi:pyruvate dehydrogenase E2 component (dihydrolipoamide acetyltransferase)
MATAVKMPQLGMTMTEAKLVRWLKREGDPVRKGEPVAEIETDKLNAEVEANAEGVVRRLVAAEGDVIPVVGLLAVIAAPDEPEAAVQAVVGGGAPAAPASAQTPTDRQAPAPALPSSERRQGVESAGAVQAAAEVRASPIARRLAAELGVDLAGVAGSGPGGRVVEADVRAAAERPTGLISPATAPAATEPAVADGAVRASPLAKRLARERGLDLRALRGSGPEGRVVERDVLAALAARQPALAAPAAAATLPSISFPLPAGLTPRETIRLDGMRRVIAERMHQSLLAMAQLTLTTEADATALVELRRHLVPAAAVYGHRPPTYTDLLVRLVARALKRHPLLNSTYRVDDAGNQEVVCWEEVNVGVAVSLERGLVVPVVRNADQQPLQALSEQVGDLAERARANRLTMDDLQGGTFTLTNLGLQDVDAFTPIVNPPQAAILGIGRIAPRPAVFEGQLAVRQLVTLSLTFDHRVLDGVPAGAFLKDVKQAIEAAALDS